ncbi:hypothetical protein GAY28_00285 [Azospirillum brasilense]|nr:hypothetical protein [Azospirillum brasilense]
MAQLMPGMLATAKRLRYEGIPPETVRAGDFAVFRYMLAMNSIGIRQMLTATPEMTEQFNRAIERGDKMAMEVYAAMQLMSFVGIPREFLVPDVVEVLSDAIRPSAELVQLLAQAHPPAGAAESLIRNLGERCLHCYIDLPPGVVRIGSLEARCLFLSTHGDGKLEGIRVEMVLTKPGANAPEGHVVWDFSSGQKPGGWIDADIDRMALVEEIENFATLLLLYRKVADKAQRGEIPRMHGREMFSNPRRAGANAKKFSLFKVETLAPPPDRFGRPKPTAGEAREWRPGLVWRSTVKPHFKLQAHGPSLSLRKLIFVEAYERGDVSAPRKQTLEVVEAPTLKM